MGYLKFFDFNFFIFIIQMKIYTDWIYDLFHIGHIESLKQCKNLFPNTHLIVGIINDNDATNYKRAPIYSENDRYEIISNLKCVDEIVKDAPLIITQEFIEKYNIDLIVHWFSNPEDASKQSDFYKIPKELSKFREIEYYKGISTTDIINKIKNIWYFKWIIY